MIRLLVFLLLALGFFAHQDERFWRGCRWGHVDGVRSDSAQVHCRGFCSVPGPLQTVQRAEMWGVVLALQTSRAVHLGVDNLGVVRHVLVRGVGWFMRFATVLFYLARLAFGVLIGFRFQLFL